MNYESNFSQSTSGIPFVAILIAGLLFYLFFCYCMKLICEKAGNDPGILIWVPILQLLPLLETAGMSPLWIIAFFVPFLNLVAGILLWVKICEARGKSALWVILMFVPCLNIFFLPYLAFSD